jgi:membrane-associated PAP2 superfamily phosphatase
MRRSTLLLSAAFVPLALLFGFFDLDRAIERAWAFDSVRQRFIAEDSFWANQLVHTGGRDFVLAVGLMAVLAALLGHVAPARFPRLVARRRPLWTGLLGAGLAVALVGILKHTTNVACPWDLAGFGGSRPYAGLFGLHHSHLPPAACFPGAHSSSGFALLAFFFAFRQAEPRLARLALLGGVGLGTIFAIAQEARGAHFLSHDLWSFYFAWLIGFLTAGVPLNQLAQSSGIGTPSTMCTANTAAPPAS